MTTEKCPYCDSLRHPSYTSHPLWVCGSSRPIWRTDQPKPRVERTHLCYSIERANRAEAEGVRLKEMLRCYPLSIKSAQLQILENDLHLTSRGYQESQFQLKAERKENDILRDELIQLREKLKKALEVATIAYRYGANGIFGYDALEARKFRTQFVELLGAKDVQLKEGE